MRYVVKNTYILLAGKRKQKVKNKSPKIKRTTTTKVKDNEILREIVPKKRREDELRREASRHL